MHAEPGRHGLGLCFGALEGVGCGFGVGGVRVAEAPVDLAGLVAAGLGGEVDDARGVGGRGADGPALLSGEGVGVALGGCELGDLVRLGGADGLLFALDGVVGDAGGAEGVDDGVGGFGGLGVERSLVGAEDLVADVHGGDVGGTNDAVGGRDGDGADVLWLGGRLGGH